MKSNAAVILSDLVEQFWGKRNAVAAKQKKTGVQGGAARTGKHMEAIQNAVRQMFIDAGMPDECVLAGSPNLPGYYRRSKSWDVVVTYKGVLVAVVELKSQVGSVGNNANNRIEEAIGNSVDLMAVQKHNSTFGPVAPWLGFVLVLEKSKNTERVLVRKKTVFDGDPDFENATYSSQYRTALSRFVSTGLYDAVWFLSTWQTANKSVDYDEPLSTGTMETFAGLVKARVAFILASLADRD